MSFRLKLWQWVPNRCVQIISFTDHKIDAIKLTSEAAGNRGNEISQVKVGIFRFPMKFSLCFSLSLRSSDCVELSIQL